MVFNYAYGFGGTVLLALLLGYPPAVWCGLGRGMRAVGYASACGTALLLVVCRGVQMIAPIGELRWILLAVFAGLAAVMWSVRSVRQEAVALLSGNGRELACLLCGVLVIGVLLGAPILFGNAIQYDGTRNADSFTFTLNARYMLDHSFYGAPDFTPEHPAYSISRLFFWCRCATAAPRSRRAACLVKRASWFRPHIFL